MRSTILLPSDRARKELNRLMAEFLNKKGTQIRKIAKGASGAPDNALWAQEQWGWQGLSVENKGERR